MPGQELDYDKAVKDCICRQLNRLLDLNSTLPPEWEKLWIEYSCERKK